MYKTHDQYGVLLVSGNCCYYYFLTNIQHTLIHKMDVSLQSRQKKGGQSAVRIARLAEERRFIYLKQVIDKMNFLFFDDNKTNLLIKGLVIAGPSEMKNMVFESDLIDYRIKPLILQTITLDTITDESIHKILNMNLFNNCNMSKEEILCHEIISAIELGECKYIYGKEEIDRYLTCNNCSCIYVHASVNYTVPNVNIIIINSTDKYGNMLCQYGGVILLSYYILPINDEISELSEF